jgi:hypothetical protein
MTTRLEALPETCGACRFAIDQSGQDFLLCFVDPPKPVAADGETEWCRGGPVESGDPGCARFSPRYSA